MVVRGVLFDLDNTLVDRVRSLDVLAAELVGVFSADLGDVDVEVVAEVLRKADGGGYREKEQVFAQILSALPWEDRPEVGDIKDFWYTTFPKCTCAVAGLHEVLEALQGQGIKLGIVTNGSEAMQNAKVDRLDVRVYMETVVVSESAGVKKPVARIFEVALEDLGLMPEEVCFVGDHPENDMAGATRVGMIPVWVRGHHSWPTGQKPLAYEIGGLMDLVDLIENEKPK
ncbi:MAG: HAD family hydrolase [bacterium]|nr:HAD family hydrolase [bacterium]